MKDISIRRKKMTTAGERLMSVLVFVVGAWVPFFNGIAGVTDIIPGGQKFPGRYIGTSIIKKNGVDYVQFQDCAVVKDAKNPQAACRAIVEVPGNLLKRYIECTRSNLEFDRNVLAVAGVAGTVVLVAALFTPVAPLVVGAAEGWTAAGLTAIPAEETLRKFNMNLQEEKLTRNIDYKTNESVVELVKRIEGLYGEITQSSCFKDSERVKLRSQIMLYGKTGPKKNVNLGSQKFFSLSGIKAETGGSSSAPKNTSSAAN